MVKHQRRSHQHGVHSSELDDGETSDSDSGESPSTPQHSGQMHWPQALQLPMHNMMPQQGQHQMMPQQSQPMHRAHSFADYSHHNIDGYPMQPSYVHRHSLSSGPHQYSHMPEHAPHMHRTPSLPASASYYVPEQNNPGVATLNTNPPQIQTHYISRPLERQEIVQSSPSSYSSASRASPVSHDTSFYTNQPQNATYALHHQSSPMEQQPMIHYQQQVPHHLRQQQAQPKLEYPATQPPVEQYQPSTPQDGQWYENVAYQAPVEVTSHVPRHENVQAYELFADPWKAEVYTDLSMQMPSARIETL